VTETCAHGALSRWRWAPPALLLLGAAYEYYPALSSLLMALIRHLGTGTRTHLPVSSAAMFSGRVL